MSNPLAATEVAIRIGRLPDLKSRSASSRSFCKRSLRKTKQGWVGILESRATGGKLTRGCWWRDIRPGTARRPGNRPLASFRRRPGYGPRFRLHRSRVLPACFACPPDQPTMKKLSWSFLCFCCFFFQVGMRGPQLRSHYIDRRIVWNSVCQRQCHSARTDPNQERVSHFPQRNSAISFQTTLLQYESFEKHCTCRKGWNPRLNIKIYQKITFCRKNIVKYQITFSLTLTLASMSLFNVRIIAIR